MHNHCVHPPCTQAWMFCGGPLLTSATTTWPSSKWENTSIESTAKIKCCKRGEAGAACTEVRSIQISSSSVCTEVRSIQINSSARNRKKEEEGQGFAGYSGITRQWSECCLSLSSPGQNDGDKGEEVVVRVPSLPVSLMAWIKGWWFHFV